MSLFDPSADLEALTTYFREQEAETKHSWQQIEQTTQVIMDDPGRDKARRAVKRAGHAGHLPVPDGDGAGVGGWGLHICGVVTATRQVVRQSKKAVRAVQRTVKIAEDQLTINGDLMPEDQRKSFEYTVVQGRALRQALRAEKNRIVAVLPANVAAMPMLPEAREAEERAEAV